MDQIDEVWGSDHDGAWQEFAGQVTGALVVDEHRIVEVEVLTAGTEVEGCRPWVCVSEDDGAWSAGVSGNDLLAAEHRLSEEQEELLERMGFREQVLGDDGESWYRRDAGPDDLDLLVELTVRALREVFGVVHPALLDWDGRPAAPPDPEPAPRPIEPGTASRDVVFPESSAELGALVEAVVGEWLGYEPDHDDDGDIPIVRGESLLFVQVCPRQPRVDLFSIVVRDVRHLRAAQREVNILNRRSRGETYYVDGDRVLMRRHVSGEPFVPAHLVGALLETTRRLDDVARDLAERVGGLRFLADDSEGVW